ncbi:hypothetical protein COCVIDRAFT_37372 [Bipolaris victoriae FI3]|uniref:PNPLA domain-containing protein n=1 Tax=Bipolaris victoriae (strain FI3) TaxID=930091 RepID=W7END1_BIPV3|nr:hypothetical protein COCVIDRAFT_37372 [Bipolaris victoriae FI3]
MAPLRLLALGKHLSYGGGVRGLHPPKPCDVFDMIVGTSTGGLIAIMLGRLEMDVEAAIDAYKRLSKRVFTPRKRTCIGGTIVHKMLGSETFDHKVLEKVIKEIVSARLGSDTDGGSVKFFVCATMVNGGIQRLRSYPSTAEEPFDCTIWEAARATSAAPTFFAPIKFPNGMDFRDGGLGANNPIFELINEVRKEYPTRDISIIVSLGTACSEIATNTEETAESFAAQYYHQQGIYRHKYFRFNPTNGLQGVGLDEWKKEDDMMANTLTYLRTTAQEDINFAPREEMLSIESALGSTFSDSLRPKIISIVGFGGSGKTQLMLQYAWTHRDTYGVVLWIDAQSLDFLNDTFSLAAEQLGLVLPRTWVSNSRTTTTVAPFIPKLQRNVDAIQKELRRRNQKWLILIDRADEIHMIDQLPKYFPSAPGGYIIVSSRRQEAERLGGHAIKLKGLPLDSAQQLLIHHVFGTSTDLDQGEQFEQAKQVVETLDCIPLAIDLAGTYIKNKLGGRIDTYVKLYECQKYELVEHALGRNHPIAQDYSASVLATWRVSINAIAKEYPGAAKFLYLLCFLDPSNLRKDLFKRACSPKLYLNREGSIDVLYPWMNRVPDWLLRLFCGPNGHWNDLQFFDTIGIISALFFIECKDLIGTWVHSSGEVEGTTLTSDGSSVTLLELPQPLHHLGRCFHDDKSREEFIHDAFSVAIHSFQNDIERDGNYSNIGRTPMMYIGF